MKALPHYGQRNYRLYWFGQMISLMGTMMQTHRAGLASAEPDSQRLATRPGGRAASFAILLFSLFGGIFVDRWPQTAYLALYTVSGHDSGTSPLGIDRDQHDTTLAYLCPGDCCWGSQTAYIYRRAGHLLSRWSGARICQCRGSELLARYSSRASWALALGDHHWRPALSPCFFCLTTLSFLPVIVGLALIKSHDLHAQTLRLASAGERQKTWQSLREGVDYVWKTPAVLLMILVVGLVLLFGSNFNVVLPLFATDALHVGVRALAFSLPRSVLARCSRRCGWPGAIRANDPPRADRDAGLWGVGGSFCSLAHYLLSLLLIASVGFTETPLPCRP